MLADACLSARNGEDNSFHRCKRPVNLVQAYLSAGKLCYSRFNHRGVSVIAVKDNFNLREDRESSFHTCGSPVKLVQACLGA